MSEKTFDLCTNSPAYHTKLADKLGKMGRKIKNSDTVGEEGGEGGWIERGHIAEKNW